MQKKIIKTVILSLVFLLMAPFVFAQEKIDIFSMQAQVQKNSSVLITESIFYDFGSGYKHGIYRDIYSKDIDVEIKSVVDKSGNKYKYDLQKTGDNIRVKIGDANQTITGEHQYIITYLVKGAIKFLPDHDEFYWNVTGNNWPVSIEQVSAGALILGKKFLDRDVQLKCYTGAFGSVYQNCFGEINFSSELETEKGVSFSTNKPLGPGEGLTIVIGWPKGVVSPPSAIEKISDFAKKYWPFIIPLGVFICLFSVWWKKGKDIKLDKSIVVQYDLPNDLCPVEVAYILNQKITPRDISAMIVDLAVKGYLKIKETEKKKLIGKTKDWVLIKQKDYVMDKSLEPFEQKLLSGFFVQKDEVSILGLKEKFFKTFEEIKEQVSKEMVLDDYFVKDPAKVMKKFTTIGLFSLFSAWFVVYLVGKIIAQYFSVDFLLNFLWVSVVSGLLFLLFATVMPKKTKKGTEVLWHIIGFKEYITRAEKYRARFYEQENIFEKFLPYAIVFGCTKKWAKAFEGIYKTPPTWYEGAVYGAYFSPVNFSNSLNKSLAGIGAVVAARPGGGSGASGFGGGGFSGGGFGGGGGGSW